MKHFSRLRARFAVATLLLLSCTALLAEPIHGTVTNKTNGKASGGDKVTLLSLSAALDEVASATTDSKGNFTLNRPDSNPYLIKVEHQKGAYFKNVPPNVSTVEITVYDVAAKVEGVSTEADVLKIESDNGQLKVTEVYFVRNSSSPPRTQSSEHTYEVVLPPDATLEGAATVGPSNMPLAATPDPVSPKGHYAFSFPIRPNEGEIGTRFQLTYHLPYSGTYKFSPREVQGADNVAVLMPKSMRFEPGPGSSFQPVPDQGTAQTFLMRDVKPGQPLEFTVSGTGSLPRDTPVAGGAGSGQGTNPQADDSAAPAGAGGRPGGGLGNPIESPDPLTKYKWWILGGLAILLTVAAAFLLRKPPGAPSAQIRPAPSPLIPTPMPAAAPQAKNEGNIRQLSSDGEPSQITMRHQPLGYSAPAAATAGSRSQLLLEALKEELFAIESEKIGGKLSSEDYAEVKAALETVLRRALSRA